MRSYSYMCCSVWLMAAFVLAGCNIRGGVATDERGERLTREQIFQAAGEGNLEYVMLGIENNVLSVDDQDANGRTMLHYAAAGNQMDMVMWLLEDYQADPNVRDNEGKTPLAYAQQSASPTLANFIVRAGGEL